MQRQVTIAGTENAKRLSIMRHFSRECAAIAIALGLAIPAMASIEVGDSFTITANYPTNRTAPYSPYTMVETADASAKNHATERFQTFCVEATEDFTSGHTYRVAGIGATTSTHYALTDYAAWLYTNFRNKTLPLLFWQDKRDTTEAKYNLLQNAIWAGMVMDAGNDTEIGKSGVSECAITDWKGYEKLGIGLTDFNKAVVGNKWKAGDLGDVVVLNMVAKDRDGNWTSPAQDQLGLVPEPATLAIWSILGVCGIGGHLVRRRRLQPKSQA
jgi:hypothetical protein